MKWITLLFISAYLCAAEVQTFISPSENVEKALITAIESEKKSVKVAIYTFTNKRIAKALVEAKKRGVDVQVLVDPFSVKIASAVNVLLDGDVPVRVYKPEGKNCWSPILHHKFCLFEESQGVWTGSYNFTYKAESSNSENAVLITGDETGYQKFNNEFNNLKTSKTEAVTKKEKPSTMKDND